MNDHRALLERIVSLIDIKASKPLKVQIARRVLGQNFNQILTARKQKTNVVFLGNELYSLNLDSIQFHGSIRLTFRCYLELFYYFSNYMLIIASRNSKFLPLKLGNCNLFFGHNFPHEKDHETNEYFIQFARENGLCSTFIVERMKSLKKPHLVGSCLFTPSPTLSFLLLKSSHAFRFRAASRLFAEFLFYFLKVPFLGCGQLIIKDMFFQSWMVDCLRKQNFKVSAFASPNSLYTQNLVFNSGISQVSRHMIWYSASAMPRRFEDEWYIDETLYFDLPIDIHYVWTAQHANFLNLSGNARTLVVGPQLFYLPSRLKKFSLPSKKIAIMDVTPTNWSIYEHTLYGENRSLWFLNEVYMALNESTIDFQKLKVDFKYKRPTEAHHSSKYIRKVEELFLAGFLDFIDPGINLFDYISGLTCLITTQLTSVGLIAEYLGIEVVYLDPFDSLPNPFSSKVKDALELKRVLISKGILDS